jgi:hypothetical protein
LNRRALRARGWTPALVLALLGEADVLVANPKNPTWAPMRLFSAERVAAAESSPAFTARRSRR